MYQLGIDIGTTTICGVVVKDGNVLFSITRKNDSSIPNRAVWEKLQDPNRILEIVEEILSELLQKYPDVTRIGVTGQMHGIVYLDQTGQPLSPLYTWQDNRGMLPFSEKETYVQHLSHLTGYPLATGFGMVTHFYNHHNGLIPKEASVFCTIHDYIAMALAGQTRPVTEASDGASLGIFDVKQGCFDTDALAAAGIDMRLLPALTVSPCIGNYHGIPVYVAIGDNQASFLGATMGNFQALLVNMGTGGQFCAYTDRYLTCNGLETRPFPLGGYLITGASLCGGRSYALLEQFWAQAAQMVSGNKPDACYDAMAQLLENTPKPDNLPILTPLFQGTRAAPHLRGSITDISTENFTPLHFTWAMLEGMAEELFAMYDAYLAAGGLPKPLIGSGNGLRKNKHLQQCVSEKFGLPLQLSLCCEEAATGAALFAGHF